MTDSNPIPSSSKPATSARNSIKLAEQVAEKIEEDIIRSGWKVGTFLGSEASLVQRHGVGRWVMREALGIVERDGLVEIRRGRNGGIMISAPAMDAVGSTIRSYLGVCHITQEDTYETRRVLESLTVRLLAQRLLPENLKRLRTLAAEAANVSDEQALAMAYRLLEEMLRATNNIALEVLGYTTAKISTDYFVRRGVTEEAMLPNVRMLIKMRLEQLEAIFAGDTARAEHLVAEYLSAHGAIGKEAHKGTEVSTELLDMPRKTLLDIDGEKHARSRPKLTHQLTQLIEAEIVANDWPVGRHLGTEAELMDRYQVSRAVLREAIRPLERFGIVEMCRGRDSGLKVTEPDPTSVIRSAVRYLTYCKLDSHSATPVRDAIELSLIELKARDSVEVRAALATQLRTVADSPPEAGPLHQQLGQVVAENADNPILGLYCRILAAFDSTAGYMGKNNKQAAGNVRKSIRALADALEAGDIALARSTLFNIRQAFEDFNKPGSG